MEAFSVAPSESWYCYSCELESPNGYRQLEDQELECTHCGEIGFLEKRSVTSTSVEAPRNEAQNETRPQPPNPLRFLELVNRQPLQTSSYNISYNDGLSYVQRESRYNATHTIAADRPAGIGFTTILDPNELGNFMQSLFGNQMEQMGFNEIIQVIMEHDNNRYGSPPASAAIVTSLPEEIITDATARGDCAICQEDFKVGEQVKRLDLNGRFCSHMFHTDCVLPWLSEHNSCPVCRCELPTDDAEYERRRQQIREQVRSQFARTQSQTSGRQANATTNDGVGSLR